MSVKNLNRWTPVNALYWFLMVCGVGLVVWQFFTFMDVVQVHTAQAQNVSRSASWAGQPVGTMVQTPRAADIRRMGHTPEAATETGMMRAVTP